MRSGRMMPSSFCCRLIFGTPVGVRILQSLTFYQPWVSGRRGNNLQSGSLVRHTRYWNQSFEFMILHRSSLPMDCSKGSWIRAPTDEEILCPGRLAAERREVDFMKYEPFANTASNFRLEKIQTIGGTTRTVEF